VKLPDSNLLIYAYNSHAPRHDRARRWLEEELSGTETVGFAWVTLLAFIRITTREGVVERPFSPAEAIGRVREWLVRPVATVIHPTQRHAALLLDLLVGTGAGGNLVTDAHLAALAIEHGATLCSSDNDFSRFPGLHWVDPLRSDGAARA
jgi:toxin-antitoxin system PIN domain toxin